MAFRNGVRKTLLVFFGQRTPRRHGVTQHQSRENYGRDGLDVEQWNGITPCGLSLFAVGSGVCLLSSRGRSCTEVDSGDGFFPRRLWTMGCWPGEAIAG